MSILNHLKLILLCFYNNQNPTMVVDFTILAFSLHIIKSKDLGYFEYNHIVLLNSDQDEVFLSRLSLLWLDSDISTNV